jgi:hypothetical protein
MIWTILGFSVGIVAFFCIVVAETIVGKSVFEQNRMYIAGVFVAAGVAAWFIGRHLGKKKPKQDDEEGLAARFLLFDLRYWGPMLVTLGVITLFIRPLRQQEVEVAHAPTPPPVKKVVAAVVPPPAPPKPEPLKPKDPVSFPELKMQGLFLNEKIPYAIINGQSYAVGDHLGEITIKAIDRTGVMLELSGELKMLTLR